jgi:hypothetical protein
MHKSPLPGQPTTVASPVPSRGKFSACRGPKLLNPAAAFVFLYAMWLSPASHAAEKGAAQDLVLGHESQDVLQRHTGQDVFNRDSLQTVLQRQGFTACGNTRFRKASYQGTTSVVPRSPLFLSFLAGFSPRGICFFYCSRSLFGSAADLPDPGRPAWASEVAEEVALRHVLKGHGLSRAAQAAYFCHSEWDLADEEPAFPATLLAQEKPLVTPEQPTPQSFDLSEDVVRDVLTNLQRGMETHDLDRVLKIFDPQNMKDYAQFREQMVAFFRRYDSVKFRYQLLQVVSDKDGGFAIADIDMDADPSDILPTPQRRSTQMRFQMKRLPQGWKVVALRPADFFNQ